MATSKSLISKEQCSEASGTSVTIGPTARLTQHSENDSLAINVVKDGNDIRFIEVQCECGKINRIVCEYE
ncbi:hypothetical protein OAG56_02855 [Mariniblastus sp.]|nr:hypothetical protein [Mariniblastus sp.]MDB4756286.1 hypothetical protein [Mariniblastus sp.]